MKRSDEGRIEVWAVNAVTPPFSLESLRQVLDATERARADRFRQPADRRRSIVSRGALRLLLGRWLECEPERVALTVAEGGKPVLREGGVEFNVAHSGDWVLIALSGSGAVGVDVEQIRPIRELDAIAAQYFAPAEAAAIRALPEWQRTAAFFACWTRKEAYLKATGAGLRTPLDRFTVSVMPDVAPALLSIDGSAAAAQAWSVADTAPAAGYASAVVGPRAMQVEVRRWAATPSAS